MNAGMKGTEQKKTTVQTKIMIYINELVRVKEPLLVK